MSYNLDELSVNEILTKINNEDKIVASVVKNAIPQIGPVIEHALLTIKHGGKIVYMGSGTSGRLGILDASECPPTFGVSSDLFKGLIAGGDKAIKFAVEDAEDDIESGGEDVERNLTKNDFLITIAASGRTPYVIGGIIKAKELGIQTAGIVCNADSKISSIVDFPIELLVGEEIINGSTRMKAGTAQKLVLNMISTTSMIKLGKVYRNYMVDVQASNQKLRDRTVDIIQELAGTDERTAKQALELCDGYLKAAVLVSKYNMNKTDVIHILNKFQDNLGKAIKYIDSKNAVN
ncbi:N-acetylmuramic acid 6-phosphate etherase [Virgibacillus siamensis]|uniref:N-acetylmuramic acid 6-phosphate etherase n=1 Tax=Virgibacillus siamensis TaxID=480071 RepID=A0ABN1FG91_9BACI